ncbi:MAG: ABC transporter ATP-binding protein [Sporolactobacillus sp.]
MLKAEQLKKSYSLKEKSGWFRRKKNLIQTVDGLDLSIDKGEIVGLLGVNGAGKTTTIKMLSTLLTPTSGKIAIDGVDAVREPERMKQKINMIAGGERMLYWRLTARENLYYFGRLYGLSGKLLGERCAYLLDLVGLNEAADRPVERYSKGMKQRLQIARGLINDPEYLFLDEPTLGLDALVARQLRQTVKGLAKERGKGILLTSHYLDEVEELCDRVYIIDKGRPLLQGTPEKIIRTVVHVFHLQAVIENEQQANVTWLTRELEKRNIEVRSDPVQEGQLLRMTASFDLTLPFLKLSAERGLLLKKLEAVKPNLEDAIVQLARESDAS